MMFRKALTNPLTSQINEHPSPVIINNEEEWEIEDILNARTNRGKMQY